MGESWQTKACRSTFLAMEQAIDLRTSLWTISTRMNLSLGHACGGYKIMIEDDGRYSQCIDDTKNVARLLQASLII
jgi:hypothetical protein